MEETEFLSNRGVVVTDARFIVQRQTYAMSGITSVKSMKQNPVRIRPVFLFFIGLPPLASGGMGIAVGLTLFAGAVAWWLSQKPEFFVVLNSASGEVEALSSEDNHFISRVVDALNQAIIHRG